MLTITLSNIFFSPGAAACITNLSWLEWAGGQKVQITAFLMSLWHSTSNNNASDYDIQWTGGQVEIL